MAQGASSIVRRRSGCSFLEAAITIDSLVCIAGSFPSISHGGVDICTIRTPSCVVRREHDSLASFASQEVCESDCTIAIPRHIL